MPGADKSRLIPSAVSESHSCIHAPHVAHADINGWPVVDPDQFPDFYGATGSSYDLGPGDTLYIPAKWWHWYAPGCGARCGYCSSGVCVCVCV